MPQIMEGPALQVIPSISQPGFCSLGRISCAQGDAHRLCLSGTIPGYACCTGTSITGPPFNLRRVPVFMLGHSPYARPQKSPLS